MTSSPLSYTGSAARIWRLAGPACVPDHWRGWRRHLAAAALALAASLLLVLAWALVTCWYVLWLPLLPVVAVWRLLRRSSRRERQAERRHRELLEEVNGHGV